jgi:GWxTD domain-containing protein
MNAAAGAAVDRVPSIVGPAVLPLALLALAAAGVIVPDDPVPEWREGPIRYILSVKEDAAYKKLLTDAERRAFIEHFWLLLDPTPATELNERRAGFWARVGAANEMYAEGMNPGWKTDRGQIRIFMGPPDRREPRPTGEVWIYTTFTKGNAPPEMEIDFHRVGPAMYRLTTNTNVHGSLSGFSIGFLDPSAEPDDVAVGTTFLGIGRTRSDNRMMKGRIRLPDFPKGEVEVTDFPTRLDVLPRFDFSAAEGGTTRLTLTVAMPPAPAGSAGDRRIPVRLDISLTLDDQATGEQAASFTEVMHPAGRPGLFQCGVSARPGTYRAHLAVFDRESRSGATRTETLTFPDFGGALALSSIFLGHAPAGPVAPVGSGGSPGREAPPLPASEPEPAFRPGETLALSYQVYNARHGGRGAALDVEYHFFLRQGDGWREIGKGVRLPGQTRESLAYALPLPGWPQGEYKVRVVIRDILANAEMSREERFRIDAP